MIEPSCDPRVLPTSAILASILTASLLGMGALYSPGSSLLSSSPTFTLLHPSFCAAQFFFLRGFPLPQSNILKLA